MQLAQNAPASDPGLGFFELAAMLDQNAHPAPEFPDVGDQLAVQRYFEELGLHELNDTEFDNERKFALALYKLLFEECGRNPHEYEHDGSTLQYRGAGWWHRDVKSYQASKQVEAVNEKGNKYKQYAARSVRFNVTLTDTRLCNIWVYTAYNSGAEQPTLHLNVRVESWYDMNLLLGEKPARVENEYDLQVEVSKLGWENIWNDEGQYWEIYHDASMSGVKREEVLSAVNKAGCDRWVKKPSWSKKKLVCLGKLPVAEKVTWRNSRNFLAQLLHYAIIRANIKILEEGKALEKALEKASPETLRKALNKAWNESPETFKKVLEETLELAHLTAELPLHLTSGKGGARHWALRQALRRALEMASPEALGETLRYVGSETLGRALAGVHPEILGKVLAMQDPEELAEELAGELSEETLGTLIKEVLGDIGPELLAGALEMVSPEELGKDLAIQDPEELAEALAMQDPEFLEEVLGECSRVQKKVGKKKKIRPPAKKKKKKATPAKKPSKKKTGGRPSRSMS